MLKVARQLLPVLMKAQRGLVFLERGRNQLLQIVVGRRVFRRLEVLASANRKKMLNNGLSQGFYSLTIRLTLG